MSHKPYIAFIIGVMLTLCPTLNNAQAKCWLGEVDSIEEKAREEKQKEGPDVAQTGNGAQYSGSGNGGNSSKQSKSMLTIDSAYLLALYSPYFSIAQPVAYSKPSKESPLSLCILYCTLKIHC